MQLAGRKVAVLGAGGSGFAAAALALSHGAIVTAFDSGTIDRLSTARDRFDGIGIELVCGEDALSPAEEFDFAILSPGIALNWPLAKIFAERSGELIGELEFAFRLSEAPIIAITGTNGKTTTTGLIDEMLRSAGLRSVAAGNIGLPFSEVVLSGESYDFIVIEASSFQLETIVSFSPRVAVWTNFAPDHMDRYESIEEYKRAKLRLFSNQGEGDSIVAKLEDQIRPGVARTFSAFSAGGDYQYDSGKILRASDGGTFDFRATKLHGRHNAENVMAALAVADSIGLSWESARVGLERFSPPPHRCEAILEHEGVLYLNDSKSTNLHSLQSALAGQEEPVVLIVGGKDKGLDFSELNEVVARQVRAAVCLGEIGPAIAAVWSAVTRCESVDSLEAAVMTASEIARSGEVVLFSPGTSSFDMFANFVERGEAFRAAVERLS